MNRAIYYALVACLLILATLSDFQRLFGKESAFSGPADAIADSRLSNYERFRAAKGGKKGGKKKKKKKKKKKSDGNGATGTATFTGNLFMNTDRCDLKPQPTDDEIFLDNVIITVTVNKKKVFGDIYKSTGTLNKSELSFSGNGSLKSPEAFFDGSAEGPDRTEDMGFGEESGAQGGHIISWDVNFPSGGFNDGPCTRGYIGTATRQ